MYCPRCGSKYEDGEKFCKYCGEPLENQINEKYDIPQPEKITDETLEKCFVGPNYDKIKSEKFSFPAFFFGAYYLLYRKMWLYALLYFTVIILINIFVEKYVLILIFGISILIGTLFNKIYMKHTKRKIEKIKVKNSDKTQEELLRICKKEGGNSPFTVVIIIFVFIIIFGVILTIFSVKGFSELFKTDTNHLIKDNFQVDELSYETPEGYELSKYSSETSKSYKTDTDDKYCRFSVSSHGTYSYKTEEEYLKKTIYISIDDKVSDIQTVTINNRDWKLITVEDDYETTYTYAILYKDKIYEVEYEIKKDENDCSTDYEQFLNTLKLIDKDLLTS